MRNHDWMSEVLMDLEHYAVENGMDEMVSQFRECRLSLDCALAAIPDSGRNVISLRGLKKQHGN